MQKIYKNPQNLKDFGHFSQFSTVAKVARGAAKYATALDPNLKYALDKNYRFSATMHCAQWSDS